MADKILNTRIQLKYDSLTNWSTKNPTLLSGELAIVTLGDSHTSTTPDNGTHPILFKVGPGAFNSLPFASALAADVYAWAKEDKIDVQKDGTGNVVSGIEWDAKANNGKGGLKYTTAAVATAEGLDELQKSVADIAKDIADNREDWAEKTVDTNTDTQYRFTTDGDKLVVYKTLYSLGVASGDEEKVGEYEFLTAEEVATTLENYYTKSEIDALVEGKLHTEAEIKSYAQTEIERLIKAADDAGGETIESIANLVDYVEKNAGEIAGLITNVGNANTNASNALTIAGEAKTLAEAADGKADQAIETANDAKEIAETAQNSASASASAAAASASLAGEKADAASGSADAAAASAGAAADSATAAAQAKGEAEAARDVAAQHKADAETAKAAALAAQSAAAASESNASESATIAGQKADAAEAARANAVIAQGKAEAAQTAAEQAKSDAEAAKQAALDSNTSATAVANAAKAEAEAATAASNAATNAVAGLHAIATSGDLYDAENVGTAKNAAGNDVSCFIFYCGSASDLV